MYSQIYIAFGVILWLSISCKKPSEDIIPSLKINDSSKVMKFNTSGGTVSFSITTNSSWRVVNSKNNLSSTFYTISSTSGTNKDSIIDISVTQNVYPYVRCDTLYFMANNAMDTVFIEQSGISVSGTLLVSFKNLYYIQGRDSIVAADITLCEGGKPNTYRNLPIDATDNASFRSNEISINSNTKIISAVFKNQKGKIRNWWDWIEGKTMPTTIDINASVYYFSAGEGTLTNPYIISNPAQVNNLRKSYHSGKFIKQDRDIDFTDATGLFKENEGFDFTKSDIFAVFYNNETGWIPIGIAGGGLPFKGNYDG
ncbi:MAG: hypothetical protein ACRC0A_02665, partial [Chitinophagaceae bacterium]